MNPDPDQDSSGRGYPVLWSVNEMLSKLIYLVKPLWQAQLGWLLLISSPSCQRPGVDHLRPNCSPLGRHSWAMVGYMVKTIVHEEDLVRGCRD